MKKYVCSICGYIHDEAVGGKWEDLPDDWKCPVCKAGKVVLYSHHFFRMPPSMFLLCLSQ